MKTYVVTSDHARMGGMSGNRKNAKAFEYAVRRSALMPCPRRRVPATDTSDAYMIDDDSPLRVAAQFRVNVRRVIRTAVDAGVIGCEQEATALRLLKLCRAEAIADIVAHTGAFTFPLEDVGAVVIEREHGDVGKLTTAADRTEKKVRAAIAPMRHRALEVAAAEVKQIAA